MVDSPFSRSSFENMSLAEQLIDMGFTKNQMYVLLALDRFQL